MKAALFDTNILLDVILDRTPHVTASAAALDLVGRGRVEGYVAGHAVTTIAYLVQREKGAAEARKALGHLLSRLRVAPVTDASVRHGARDAARRLRGRRVCGLGTGGRLRLIVTRNPQHFRKAEPPAMLPEAFVALQSEPNRRTLPRSVRAAEAPQEQLRVRPGR